jgi:hypothetical protein
MEEELLPRPLSLLAGKLASSKTREVIIRIFTDGTRRGQQIESFAAPGLGRK